MNSRNGEFGDCFGETLHALFDDFRGREGVAQSGIVDPRAGSGAEGITGNEGHLLVDGLFKKVVGVYRGELQPVEEASFGLDPRDSKGCEVFFEALLHSVPLHPVVANDHGKVTVEVAVDAVLRHQCLGDWAGAEVRSLFEHGEVPDDLLRAGYPAYAGSGGEDFREGPGIDHPALVMEGEYGRQVLAFVPDVSVRVVLENGDIVLFGYLHQLFAPLHRHGGAAGIVEVHDGVDELDLFSFGPGFLDYAGDKVNLHTVPVSGDAEKAAAVVEEHRESRKVGGVFSNDIIPLVDHGPCEEIKGLLRSGSDEHFVRSDLAPHSLCRPRCEEFLERRVSLGSSVLEKILPLVFEDMNSFIELVDRENLGGRHAPREGDHAGLLDHCQHFPDW
ncbi:hypothetical protein SDC9_40738 [bioreactor metagenome]|uniref:Uncharacterized protein n=1 Tax=bioreactor metagenome TaxID=1076179 RepID=A0A644VT51_9ZZZZ